MLLILGMSAAAVIIGGCTVLKVPQNYLHAAEQREICRKADFQGVAYHSFLGFLRAEPGCARCIYDYVAETYLLLDYALPKIENPDPLRYEPSVAPELCMPGRSL